MISNILKGESKKSIERMNELMRKVKIGIINTIDLNWKKNIGNGIREIPNGNDCHIYLRSKLISLQKPESSKITFEEISSLLEDYKNCTTLFSTSFFLPPWIIESCDNYLVNVVQKKGAMDTWAQKIASELEEKQISTLDIQDKLVHGYRLLQQISPQFSFLEASILPTIQLLQQKAILLLGNMIDSVSHQFTANLPVSSSNLKIFGKTFFKFIFYTIDNLRIQLLKSSMLRGESASFKWVTSTEVYSKYVSLLKEIDHKMGDYYVNVMLGKNTRKIVCDFSMQKESEI